MNIFETQEAKIKSYLRILSRRGASTPKKAVLIEDVEGALKIENRVFDDITKYLLAQGLIKRSAGGVYLTKLGVTKV